MCCASGCGAVNWFILTSNSTFTTTPASHGIPYSHISVCSNNINLTGWYIPGAPGSPLILLFHGNAGNISDSMEYIKIFHGSGFSVCCFDYRGYGASSGECFGEEDLYEDARKMIAALRLRGWPSSRIIYYGQSMGAAVALQMAMETPPAGLVLESAFSSFAEVATFHAPVAYWLLGRLLIDMSFENTAKISRVTAPVLIIHGDSDEVVPFQMSLQLFDGARSRKQLYLIRGGGHCDGFAGDKAAVTRVIRGFVDAVSD